MTTFQKAAIETEDFHRRVFREQYERDERLRAIFLPRVEPVYEVDAEEFFLDQQSPSESAFR